MIFNLYLSIGLVWRKRKIKNSLPLLTLWKKQKIHFIVQKEEKGFMNQATPKYQPEA